MIYPIEKKISAALGREKTDLVLKNANIIDVFDQANQSLLILGEPGSGKTIMLLELARHTLARAQSDLTQPIPVVFNLSAWGEKRLPLTEWLIEEFKSPDEGARKGPK